MSVERPNLWRVLSDTTRIIRSNSLHFLALSLLFIFPISLFNIIYALLLQPSPSQLPLINSHYRRLLSTVSNSESVSRIPSSDKTLILCSLILLILNLCAISSVTHSIFHAFHSKPIKFTDSLKSILSSFLPLLATKIVYLLIIAGTVFGFFFCMGLVFMLLGFEIKATNKPVMVVVCVMMILLVAMLVYLTVKWYLMDAVAVVESKYGFAPLERSSGLMKGARRVAFLMIILFATLQMMLSGWFSVLTRGNGGVGVGVLLQLVVYAAFYTVLSVFGLAAETVLFVHCTELNAESGELEFQSEEKKLGKLYVPVPQEEV